MSLSIYHIEDNLGDQVIVKNYLASLKRWESRLVVFNRLATALDQLKTDIPDLILLDLSLPDSSNLEGLRRIMALNSKLCVIILTGNLKKELGFEAIKLGAEDFLNKNDLNKETLEKAIGFSLERSKLKQENLVLKRDLFLNNSRLNSFDVVNFAYVVRTDIKGNYTYANNLFTKTFLKPKDNLIGSNSLKHIYEGDHPAVFSTVERAMAKPGQVFTIKLRKPLLIPGILKTTIWDFVALTNESEEIVEIQCTGYDLTEQSESQLEILRIRRENELILRNSSSLSLILNSDFIIEYEIGEISGLFGSNDSLIGKDFELFIHLEDLNIWKSFTNKFLSTKVESSSLNLRINSNNTINWVNLSINSIDKSRINDRYTLILKNINKEHEQEANILYKEKKYRALFEHNPSIIITSDFITGKVIEVNRAFEKKLKFRSKEVVDKTIYDLLIWPNVIEHNDFIAQLAAKGEHRIANSLLVSRDGNKHHVNVNGIVINLNDHLLNIIIAEDISKEISLSDQLKSQEEIYRALVNNSDNLYLVLTNDLRLIFTSPQLGLLDYNYKNLIDHNLLEYINSKDRKYIEKTALKAWKQKSEKATNLEPFKIIDRAGVHKWFNGKISYLTHFPHQPEGVLVFYLKDINTEYQLSKEKNALHEQTLEVLGDLEYYKKILDKHALVAIIDTDGKFLNVNEYYLKTNGYSSQELVGQSTRLINSSYHSKEFYQNLWQTIQAGEIWQGEFRNKRKDGSLYWSKTTIAPRIDENTGKVINYISIHTDISELKDTQENLNKSKTNLRNTLNSIKSDVWSIDLNYKLRTYNLNFKNNFKDFYNYDIHEKENMLEIPVLSSEMIDKFTTRYLKAFKGITDTYYDSYINPITGKNQQYELIVLPFVNNKNEVSGATVYSQDITERRENESKLRELLIRFELATKSNSMGIWDLDLKTNSLIWDQNMFDLYEMNEDEGTSWNAWMSRMSEKSYEIFNSEFTKALVKNENFATNFKIKIADGFKYISSLARIIRNTDGTAVRVVGLNWDITDTANYEEKLKHSLHEKENILNTINDGFIIFNNNLEIESINKSACKILDINQKDVIGKSLWEKETDKANSSFYATIKHSLESGEIGHIVGQDRISNNWIDASIYPQEKGLVIFFKDISIEKEREFELEKLRNNQAALINTTQDLIWSINTDFEVIAFNKQYGQHQLSIGNTNPQPGKSILSNHSDPASDFWKRRYEKALQGQIIEETIRENNLSFSVSLYPIIDSQNEVEGVACYARDISETEAYLTTIENQNNELKNIAWMQSHIVRAPVARILGLIELIYDEKLAVDHDLKGYLQSIDMSAKELDNIIKKITEKTYSAKIKGI